MASHTGQGRKELQEWCCEVRKKGQTDSSQEESNDDVSGRALAGAKCTLWLPENAAKERAVTTGESSTSKPEQWIKLCLCCKAVPSSLRFNGGSVFVPMSIPRLLVRILLLLVFPQGLGASCKSARTTDSCSS